MCTGGCVPQSPLRDGSLQGFYGSVKFVALGYEEGDYVIGRHSPGSYHGSRSCLITAYARAK